MLQGGVLLVKTLHCIKLRLKSILSHSEAFWEKQFWVKFFFFAKVPKSGLVSYMNYVDTKSRARSFLRQELKECTCLT